MFRPLVCIVDFHHHRGPEVEKWFGVVDNGRDPVAEHDWDLLPFLALPDGAHATDEELSYFTLRQKATAEHAHASSLFGISCTRQLDARELANKSPDVTRSSVQKAIVAILDSPYLFARIREKLSAVTKAWFAQRDFSDDAIIYQFQEDLVSSCSLDLGERDQYVGLSLREVIHQYKWQTLVLFKCALLQPKMLFFGANCERMCLLQFSLISLLPGLINNLQDCADPSYNTYEDTLKVPSSLQTSSRASLLSFMGLPLQLFGKGSLFGPYTPLQQLDVLEDAGTKSYVVGSTNALLLRQKDKPNHVLINLDEGTIDMSTPQLRSALTLTVSDRRFIDLITQSVQDTWDGANPSRPTTLAYAGSEDFIRRQFEEYLLALLSCAKYRQYKEKCGHQARPLETEGQKDPWLDFGTDWLEVWAKTDNYRIFNKFTDSHLFDIIEPRHPCAGGLTIEDIQRRIAQQVADLNLDERLNYSREAIGKSLWTGREKVSSAYNKMWSDIELMRENQRRRAEDRRKASELEQEKARAAKSEDGSGLDAQSPRSPDLSQAKETVQAASSRASAYLSSWGSWAAEKRKTGWSRSTSSTVESEQRRGEPSLEEETETAYETEPRQIFSQSRPTTSDEAQLTAQIKNLDLESSSSRG